jgi:hypothetical protein
MKLFKLDYKGKHFILSDTSDDEMVECVGEINYEDVTQDFLYKHVPICMYYGIPAYIGKDEELNGRIDFIVEELTTKYNEQHQ